MIFVIGWTPQAHYSLLCLSKEFIYYVINHFATPMYINRFRHYYVAEDMNLLRIFTLHRWNFLGKISSLLIETSDSWQLTVWTLSQQLHDLRKLRPWTIVAITICSVKIIWYRCLLLPNNYTNYTSNIAINLFAKMLKWISCFQNKHLF